MYTLTTKVGRFTFQSDVLLSHAKLLRDTVLGQLTHPQGGPKLTSVNAVQDFARNLPGDILSSVEFGFKFA